MIQLCKHLDDRGQCEIKQQMDTGESTCPAIRLTVAYSRISEINYSLMQQMACSDKWEPARMGIELEHDVDIPSMEEVEQDLKEHTCTKCGRVDTYDEETFHEVMRDHLCATCYQTIGEMRRETEKVTTEFIESLPTWACSECEREFHAENPTKMGGKIVCSDCYCEAEGEPSCVSGTHPDPEQHHCRECGLIYSHVDWCFEYGTCKKCAEHLDFKKLKERVAEAKKAEPSVCEEKNEIQFTQIFGNVWAAISGESVHLKYGNSKCGIWDRTIFDTLLEMTEEERRKEIDELVKGMASKQQRKACLRQFTIALAKGEVSFPEVA